MNKKIIAIITIAIMISMMFTMGYSSNNHVDSKIANPFTGYTTTFEEKGLVAGTSWTISVDGSTFTTTNTTQIARLGTSGTYNTSWSATGYEGGYEDVTYPDSTTIIVNFVQEANITFTAYGLLNNTSWTLVFDNTTHTSSSAYIHIGYYLPAKYTFSWSASGYLGGTETEKISAGNQNITLPFATVVNVIFKPYYFTFSEKGLPIGTQWNLTISNKEYQIVNTTIQIPEYNGSGQYDVSYSAEGYSANPINQVITGGSNQSFVVVFSPFYLLTLSFSANPGYIDITTSVGNFNISTTTLTLTVQQGSYFTYTVYPSSGYLASPVSETVQISGNMTIHISVTTPPAEPFYYSYDFVYLMMAIGIIALIGMLYVKRGSLL